MTRSAKSAGRTGAVALVEGLVRAGAEIVFGYPGGNVLDVFDALRDSPLRFVLGRHEQGCVHAADGYARASGRPGVVLVTSGPGLTNAITGLGCANMDGVPLVLVCGQVALDEIGTDAFQEADTTGLTRAVSKHNFLVKSADEIPETIAQAFYIATHGKPGPVVIDLPRDVQRALTAKPYPERVVLRAYHPDVSPQTRDVNALAKLLNGARRPILYAGGGVIASGASEDVVRLAHKAEIPVATTLMGLGTIDAKDPLSLGLAGLYGTCAANAAIAEADLVLALGVRFNDRVTGKVSKYARKAKIVHVDLDPSAIGKNVRTNLSVVADIKDLLTTVDSRIRPAAHGDWLERIAVWRKGCPASPQGVVEAVAEATDGEAIVVTDVGQHQLWTARTYPHRLPRHFITSGGMGAMGFGIPAAIGAALARPDAKVVAILGDGGAQMTSEELAVAAELKLPITFIVFRNDALGLVRQEQRRLCGGRYFATDLKSPDFVALAKAYGLRASRANGNVSESIGRAIRVKGPALVEVAIPKEAEV